MMTLYIVLALLFVGSICFVAGCEKGYSDALAEIFVEAPTCPHGYGWDECPDCRH